MDRESSNGYEIPEDETRLKKIYRELFVSANRPGPLAVFSMLGGAILLFIFAYAIGNWI